MEVYGLHSGPYTILAWTELSVNCHIAPKKIVLFVILYRICGLKNNSYCLTTSTNYCINRKRFSIKVLKSKPFKNDLIDQYYFNE